MSKVRSRDTKPELAVRRIVFRLGYRYRLHRKDLAGKPDLVFASKRKIIFVHGCFWHGHKCSFGRLPKSNIGFWLDKITTNHRRDKTTLRKLRVLGWKSLVIWECQLKNTNRIAKRIKTFLG